VSSERPIRRTGDVALSAEPSSEDVRVHITLRLKKDDLELAVGQLNHDRRNAPSHAALCKLACRIYDARREREKMLDRKLFGEAGWDMLLALYCLPTRGERLSVTALSGASAVSLTAALRWQGALLEDGLIERVPDESDARRDFVRLSDKGRCMLEDYLFWLHHTGGFETVVD
jgi:DNA-binding MarR family transcriptional regulator